jgi:hypothetical protein
LTQFAKPNAVGDTHFANPGLAFFFVTFFLSGAKRVTRQRQNRMLKNELDQGNEKFKVALNEASAIRYNDHRNVSFGASCDSVASL